MICLAKGGAGPLFSYKPQLNQSTNTFYAARPTIPTSSEVTSPRSDTPKAYNQLIFLGCMAAPHSSLYHTNGSRKTEPHSKNLSSYVCVSWVSQAGKECRLTNLEKRKPFSESTQEETCLHTPNVFLEARAPVEEQGNHGSTQK